MEKRPGKLLEKVVMGRAYWCGIQWSDPANFAVVSQLRSCSLLAEVEQNFHLSVYDVLTHTQKDQERPCFQVTTRLDSDAYSQAG